MIFDKNRSRGDNRRDKGNDRVARPTFVEKDRFASRNKLHANYLSLLIVNLGAMLDESSDYEILDKNVRIDIRGNRRNGRFLIRENRSSA